MGTAVGREGLTPCLRQVLTKQQQEQAASNDFNFDHPDAFDFDLIIATLKKLKQGKSVKIPIYDFTTHSRKKEWVWDTEGQGGGLPRQERGSCLGPPAPAICRQTRAVALWSVSVSGCIFRVSSTADAVTDNPERYPGMGQL